MWIPKNVAYVPSSGTRHDLPSSQALGVDRTGRSWISRSGSELPWRGNQPVGSPNMVSFQPGSGPHLPPAEPNAYRFPRQDNRSLRNHTSTHNGGTPPRSTERGFGTALWPAMARLPPPANLIAAQAAQTLGYWNQGPASIPPDRQLPIVQPRLRRHSICAPARADNPYTRISAPNPGYRGAGYGSFLDRRDTYTPGTNAQGPFGPENYGNRSWTAGMMVHNR